MKECLWLKYRPNYPNNKRVAPAVSYTHLTAKPSSAPYVKRGTLSIEKARNLIGYDPQNEIQIGYRKYIEWCIANEKVIHQFNTQIP